MPRQRDAIWKFFKQSQKAGNKGVWATCLRCNKEMQRIPSRMKVHYDDCLASNVSILSVSCDVNNDENEENITVVDSQELTMEANSVTSLSSQSYNTPSGTAAGLPSQDDPIPGCSSWSTTSGGSDQGCLSQTNRKRKLLSHTSLAVVKDSTVICTSDAYAAKIDNQLACYFFATNTPFQHIEHPEFKKVCEIMRPRYTPPSRKQLAGPILDEVYSSEIVKCRNLLQGQIVSLCLDGWSNVHNEPVVCSAAVLPGGDTYLVDTYDTSGSPHTADYLATLARSSIRKCKAEYGATVKSVVTDNAANVKKMRELLKTDAEENQGIDVIAYGCSAHLLNLLSADVEVSGIKERIVAVAKYFRNKQLPAAWYKDAGGSMLVLPQEVRWNTLKDTLASFLKTRGILVQVYQDHKDDIDKNIFQTVNDVNIAVNASDYMQRMNPIAIALDKAQRSDTMIADVVEVWHELEESLSGQPDNVMRSLKLRGDQALGPAHYLANIMNHRYQGKNLDDAQKDAAYTYISATPLNPDLVPYVVGLQCEDIFPKYLFSEVFHKVSPMSWWRMAAQSISNLTAREELLDICSCLFSAVASTAGLERIFSSFGLVHSKLR